MIKHAIVMRPQTSHPNKAGTQHTWFSPNKVNEEGREGGTIRDHQTKARHVLCRGKRGGVEGRGGLGESPIIKEANFTRGGGYPRQNKSR